jgi:hypothetical protein
MVDSLLSMIWVIKDVVILERLSGTWGHLGVNVCMCVCVCMCMYVKIYSEEIGSNSMKTVIFLV